MVSSRSSLTRATGAFFAVLLTKTVPLACAQDNGDHPIAQRDFRPGGGGGGGGGGGWHFSYFSADNSLACCPDGKPKYGNETCCRDGFTVRNLLTFISREKILGLQFVVQSLTISFYSATLEIARAVAQYVLRFLLLKPTLPSNQTTLPAQTLPNTQTPPAQIQPAAAQIQPAQTLPKALSVT